MVYYLIIVYNKRVVQFYRKNTIKLKDNKIFSYSSNMTIKQKETLSLTMNETNEKDFKNLFNNQ